MRTKPANRYSHPNQHAQFGIYNWFRNKGVVDMETMKECIYRFCESNEFEMKGFKNEPKMLNWVQNRFAKFSQFTVNYLKENNYLPIKSITPDWINKLK